jgi:hypothetical protein
MLCPTCRKKGLEYEVEDYPDPTYCRHCGWEPFKENDKRTFYLEYTAERKSGYISVIGRDDHGHLLVVISDQYIAEAFGLAEEMEKYGYVAVDWLDVNHNTQEIVMAPMLLMPEDIGKRDCPMSVGKSPTVTFWELRELLQ